MVGFSALQVLSVGEAVGAIQADGGQEREAEPLLHHLRGGQGARPRDEGAARLQGLPWCRRQDDIMIKGERRGGLNRRRRMMVMLMIGAKLNSRLET
jgi:hypothetical protein